MANKKLSNNLLSNLNGIFLTLESQKTSLMSLMTINDKKLSKIC